MRLGCGEGWGRGEIRRESTFEDPHGGGEVVDSPCGFQGGGDNGGGGDEVVGEGIV